MFGSTEAFLGGSLRPCDIQVEGIAGNISVTSLGTVRLLVPTRDGEHIICLFHNVLSSTGCHDLLSVSQIHSGDCDHKVKFDNVSPSMTIRRNARSRRRGIHIIDLILQDGLYEFPGTPISDNDSRLASLPTIEMTPPGLFEPVHTALWSRKVLVAPVTTLPLTFGEALSELSSSFVAPASIPASRRKYCQGVPSDMEDLSVRFMGSGQDRLLLGGCRCLLLQCRGRLFRSRLCLGGLFGCCDCVESVSEHLVVTRKAGWDVSVGVGA